MRDIQGLAGVFFLLTLVEEKHVHEIRMNHVQIPDAREKSLPEDTVKNVQKGRQLIGLLLSLGVNLHRTIGPKGLLVSGGSIAVRAETDWSVKSVIFPSKRRNWGNTNIHGKRTRWGSTPPKEMERDDPETTAHRSPLAARRC